MLLIGTTALPFFLAALILYKFPPKKINDLYGYRTRSSKVNQENWDFSQKYAAKLMMWLALGMAVLNLIVSLFSFSDAIQVVFALAILIFSCVVLFVKAEKEIKKRFGMMKKS